LLRRLRAFNVAARWKGGSDCGLRVLWSLGMPGAWDRVGARLPRPSAGGSRDRLTSRGDRRRGWCR